VGDLSQQKTILGAGPPPPHPPLKRGVKSYRLLSSSSREPIASSGEVLPENPKKEKKRREGFKLNFLLVRGSRR